MTNYESYSNYQQCKPLSSRLSVEAGTMEPTNTKRRPKATAEPEGLPAYIQPLRTSGKQQGTAEGTAGELKDYLLSEGDTEGLSGWEAHAAQKLMEGNSDAIDCFLLVDCRPITTLNKYGIYTG